MKTVIHELTFKVTPKILFELYMDSKKHSMATGAKAVMSRKAGGSFKAHHDYSQQDDRSNLARVRLAQERRGFHFHPVVQANRERNRNDHGPHQSFPKTGHPCEQGLA